MRVTRGRWNASRWTTAPSSLAMWATGAMPSSTELGYRVAQSAQGRGQASDGVTFALAQAAARGVATVSARVEEANVGSCRVLEKCAFTRTGRWLRRMARFVRSWATLLCPNPILVSREFWPRPHQGYLR